MTEHFESEDRELLREIFKQPNGVSYYFFHEKYLLSPAQLARSILKLKKLRVVYTKDDLVKITTTGRKWVLKNRKIIFSGKNQHWKNLPTNSHRDHFEQAQDLSEEGSKTYFPKMTKMDSRFFGFVDNQKNTHK